MYNCIFSDVGSGVCHSVVQICSYPDMSMLQVDQPIPKDQWIQWDAEAIAQQAAQEIQGSDIDTASNSSDDIILNEVNSDMIIDCDIIESESVNNDLDELPDINQLRAELTILGGSDSPPPNFIAPANYRPATLDIHQSHLLLTVPVKVQ